MGGDGWSMMGSGATWPGSQNRLSLYTRVSYDIAPNLNVWATAQFGEAQTRNTPTPGVFYAGNQTIQCGNTPGGPNAFLPASIQQACLPFNAVTNPNGVTALGITSFAFG